MQSLGSGSEGFSQYRDHLDQPAGAETEAEDRAVLKILAGHVVKDTRGGARIHIEANGELKASVVRSGQRQYYSIKLSVGDRDLIHEAVENAQRAVEGLVDPKQEEFKKQLKQKLYGICLLISDLTRQSDSSNKELHKQSSMDQRRITTLYNPEDGRINEFTSQQGKLKQTNTFSDENLSEQGSFQSLALRCQETFSNILEPTSLPMHVMFERIDEDDDEDGDMHVMFERIDEPEPTSLPIDDDDEDEEMSLSDSDSEFGSVLSRDLSSHEEEDSISSDLFPGAFAAGGVIDPATDDDSDDESD